ncbi:MAG: hypothetical protein JXR83_03800 [Deltaproteobacteria bacterium]|nr:hypothetical protein [Deltaproteobacteria bacterium]
MKALGIALLLLAVTSCQLRGDPGASTADQHRDDWKSGALPPDAGSVLDAGESAPGTEICDGWDNDGDGDIDEETGGGACSLAAGGTGIAHCLRGALVCLECAPGQVRVGECPCSGDRIDICLDDGTWYAGSCDGCEQPEQPCECTPGELMVQRCDTCSGPDCGATCVGTTLTCNEHCLWEPIAACTAMNPQCNSDQQLDEPCGKCGHRHKRCDGCFWTESACLDQGACLPGEVRTVPCAESQCAPGLVATIECNAQCEWGPPAACTGCAIGAVVEREIPCLPGRDCGHTVERTTCVEDHSVPVCGDSAELKVGIQHSEIIGECRIECVPGTLERCQLDDGRGGVREIGCDDHCQLTGVSEPCGASSSSCPPGEVRRTSIPCGCGVSYTRVETCNPDGYGWSSSSEGRELCPECSTGQTRTVSCTTPQGGCGQGTLVCDSQCQYPANPNTCLPLDEACTPGQTQVEQRSCGANTCGLTYSITRTCLASGCGWSGEAEDRSRCPSCQAGQQRETSQLCRPEYGAACGYVKQVCDLNSCQWTDMACPPCNG